MPFESKAQMKWTFANKPAMARKWASHTKDMKSLPMHKEASEKGHGQAHEKKESKPIEKAEHHSGKGTRARLNTAGQKMFFGRKVSK